MFKSFKIFSKILYKKIISTIFYLIYGKPKLLKIRSNDESIEEYKVNLEGNYYEIYKLKEGSIFTDTNDTIAYVSKNNFLSSASMQFYKIDKINSVNGSISRNETLISGTPKIKKKINGNVLSLLSGGAGKDNFTHWFTDIIPRLKIFSLKFKLSKIDKYYVPSIKYKFQIETLKFLGIKQDQIISSEKYKHIKCNNVYATSHPCYFFPKKIKKWSLKYINEKFSKNSYKNKYQKIFVDRDQFKLININNLNEFKDYRILINEDEIKKYLKSQGFDIIKPEDYTFKEQVKIFSSARVVVGLYGAAMMMLGFCKKNTKVIEIKPKLSGNEFKNISKLQKLKHRQIKLNPLIKSSIPQNGLIICPIKKIQKEINS